ncbi:MULTISPECIES: hypothetical protein [unclassified Nostoc]|uniref:hypothetical protein n=1 Tax=unclassified Nostoc TaxID=2593658 RepID=UPI0025AB4FDF|nr:MULTISPECIES: hypothetical protein [unclassified Nostoc]MDM9583751.1 hypothetical protein [Nostoc sp. GT001]MDZ7946009.1 hypothetical protein [Nostoc sp. EfeVER01]MDZ7995138.1 hypothetical protein [Nostoc sp. EspVER01]
MTSNTVYLILRYYNFVKFCLKNLSFPPIQRLIYANVTMMDEYMPGIMSVIYGNVSPEEAMPTATRSRSVSDRRSGNAKIEG